MNTKMVHYFEWGSSEVDWCEHNFEILSCVAEFWNTVSNVLFFVLPPVLIYLFQQYGRCVKTGVHLVWALLIVVGAGSVYFHATLSLVGQLLDEIAIIWVVITAMALWTPKKYMPSFCNQNRKVFHKVMLVFAILCTGLACIRPEINCMVLFVLGVPSTIILVSEVRRCQSPNVFNLGIRCFITWSLALASWTSDRFLCNLWVYINFPYLHCAWHVCIALSSYQACVLMAYFDALTEVPEYKPVLKYWPSEKFGILGVPYVAFDNIEEKSLLKGC